MKAFGVGLFFIFSFTLAADAVLIREVQKLRDSLSADDPSRQELALRLGDLYVDEIVSLSRGQELTPLLQKNISQMRLNAIREFGEALNGHGGKFKALSGARKFKVQFQLARLHSDGGDPVRALPLWQALLSQDEVTDLKREAALRLAEIEEQDGRYAKSENLYERAIELCGGSDVCSYAHYRKAWTQKRQGRLNEAIDTIQKALFDSKGQVRDEALRDFMIFLSERKTDGRAELSLMEPLAEKMARPQVLSELADQFFAAGNKVAGVYILSLVDGRSPSLTTKIRLLEEVYGLRRWDDFRSLMNASRDLAGQARESTGPETNKILRRLMVQLDGERASQKDRLEDFENAVELYLTLFPKSSDLVKIMEGWLAAEPDLDKKRSQVRQWLDNTLFALTPEDRIKFREILAAIAQKKGDHLELAAEAEHIVKLTTDAAKKREFTYTRARSLYALERYQEALPYFRELAAVTNQKPDSWAIQSQNLALDIYGRLGDFNSVIAQAELWTRSPVLSSFLKSDAQLRQEINEMAEVIDKARFEIATLQGQTPQSLDVFLDFCTTKKFLPKSCDNAKVLAVSLKNQKAIFDVLHATGARQELVLEYEAAGYFRKAAELLEGDLNKSSPVATRIKVALLYELGQSEKDRNRILSSLLESLQGHKDLGGEEQLLFVTARDAGILNSKHLSLPWTAEHRAIVAEDLEASGRGSPETRRLLLSAERMTGKAWVSLVWREFEMLDKAQRKIQFYGRQSKKNFERRIAAVKKVVDFSDLYLPRGDLDFQVKILAALEKSHRDFAQEILATPIPPEVSDEQIREIRTVLSQLAEPVEAKAKSYAEMIAKAQATVANVADANEDSEAVGDLHAASIDTKIASSMEVLHQDPANLEALETLKEAYGLKNQDRLAGYFRGRILQSQNAKR